MKKILLFLVMLILSVVFLTDCSGVVPPPPTEEDGKIKTVDCGPVEEPTESKGGNEDNGDSGYVTWGTTQVEPGDITSSSYPPANSEIGDQYTGPSGTTYELVPPSAEAVALANALGIDPPVGDWVPVEDS